MHCFDPKMRDITSLKRHFLESSLTGFSESMLEDYELILDNILQVSRVTGYLLSF